MFTGKSILITGGTGSFGQECVREILRTYRPERLIIYSRDELKQFDMAQELNASCMRYVIGDVRDRDRLVQAMHGVDMVIHAAAIKQVPTAEYNPMECIKTNVHGAENVIQAALANNVDKVISLSTDKAVNPINMYGASKLASDKLFVAANASVGRRPTRFAVVRYGNVVGSRGSVVPFFRRLIHDGSPYMPITDARMTRFWISAQQGVDFVIASFERMRGGEVFVPKIPSVRITALATAMAPDLPHRVIGMRPGEKIHEVLCPADESHLTLEFADHFVLRPAIRFPDLDACYSPNMLGEHGAAVEAEFEYNSGRNRCFLELSEIVDSIRPAGPHGDSALASVSEQRAPTPLASHGPVMPPSSRQLEAGGVHHLAAVDADRIAELRSSAGVRPDSPQHEDPQSSSMDLTADRRPVRRTRIASSSS